MNGEPISNSRSINVNTGVSLGLVVLCVAGFLTVMKGQSDNNVQLKTLDTRLQTLETGKNAITPVELLKWAVHLQQLNDGRSGHPLINVPEPEIHQ